MCSLGSPEIGWATTRNAKHVESGNTQPKNEWMNEKCFVIIIVVCYSPLPFSGNVVRACKIISRLASRTHLHIKTAFVCVAFPRKPRKQKVRVIFNWTKKVKPNRSLGIKFLCVSQFDFAVVATTAFYLNFPRAFITTEMTALILPVRLDGHVIKVACKRSTEQPVYITIMWITMPLTALQNPSLVNVI